MPSLLSNQLTLVLTNRRVVASAVAACVIVLVLLLIMTASVDESGDMSRGVSSSTAFGRRQSQLHDELYCSADVVKAVAASEAAKSGLLSKAFAATGQWQQQKGAEGPNPHVVADSGRVSVGHVVANKLAAACVGTLSIEGNTTSILSLADDKHDKSAATKELNPLGASPYPGTGPLFVLVTYAHARWDLYISLEFHSMIRTLLDVYRWQWYGLRAGPDAYKESGGGWAQVEREMVATFGRRPDVVYFLEEYELTLQLDRAVPGSSIRDSLARGCTKVYQYTDDLHWFTEEQKTTKLTAMQRADRVMSTYAPVFEQVTGLALGSRVMHVPHAASPHFLLPLNTRPVNRILLAGSTAPEWYPYRALVKDKIAKGDIRFVELPHPGYSFENGGRDKIGLGFGLELNRYRACITDGSRLNYTVAKIFEIPATGCLLVLNVEMMPFVAQLGFQPFVHYVPYDRDTLDDVADFVLDPDNRDDIDSVRARGQALVWSRHTMGHRMATLHAYATFDTATCADE